MHSAHPVAFLWTRHILCGAMWILCACQLQGKSQRKTHLFLLQVRHTTGTCICAVKKRPGIVCVCCAGRKSVAEWWLRNSKMSTAAARRERSKEFRLRTCTLATTDKHTKVEKQQRRRARSSGKQRALRVVTAARSFKSRGAIKIAGEERKQKIRFCASQRWFWPSFFRHFPPIRNLDLSTLETWIVIALNERDNILLKLAPLDLFAGVGVK